MSFENALAFLDRLDNDAALAHQVQSREDAVRLSAELDIPFTEDELTQAYEQRQGDVSEADLKNVSAGWMLR